ncbi:hypothetical protein T03_14486 [Trichinella britovi]|uniref:Uncharacterized protein n=1 Tax=Trichinella britovi TaxID=45882 RepID=A0A0V1BDV3_TRIBR|nr:hypothetical protein T03_14486 [Trichinella britovi]
MPSNHVRREQKETIEHLKFCIYQSRLAIKVAVTGERAQSSFDVVFSAVGCVALFMCGWLPAKTASTAMLLVNLFVSSIGGEAQ